MPKIDFFGGKRSLMLVTPLKEREKRSTWKDGGRDTPEIQLKTAFIEIDGQPMMNDDVIRISLEKLEVHLQAQLRSRMQLGFLLLHMLMRPKVLYQGQGSSEVRFGGECKICVIF